MSSNSPVPLPGAAPRRTLGLQWRVLLFFGVILLATLGFRTFYLFNIVTLTEESLWQGRQNDAVRNAADRVATFVDTARRTLGVIAREESDPAATLAALVAQNPALLEIVLVDQNGQLLYSESPAPSVLMFETARTRRSWFRATREAPSETYIGPLERFVSGEPYLIMAQATRSGGAVAARVDMEVLAEIVQTLRFGESGTSYIVQEDGFLIVHTEPTVVEENTTLAGTQEFQWLTDPAARVPEYVNFQGENVLGAAAQVPQTNWYIVTELLDDEAYARGDAAIQSVALFSLLFGVTAMAVVVYFMRGILFKPLAQLAQGTEAVEAGSLAVQVPITRHDEIGQVTASFNRMVHRLAERTTEREELLNELSTTVEELQTANRRAQESIQVKSEFLATMSHELRTPMHAIEGFVGILLSRMAGTEYNDKTHHYLQRVNANSRRLLELINDFLDLSRVEAGRLELAHVPFMPGALADNWMTELSGMAEEKGIAFTVTVDPALPKTLYGDEDAINKVALNLLGNAIKFTEKGSVSLHLEKGDGVWRIRVQDTGIGIPHHAREFIFEEFRQVDQSSRRKYGGTGLGLAIVQKYTRTMGGTVTVESEPGQGSTFTVTLPLMNPAPEPARKVQRAEPMPV